MLDAGAGESPSDKSRVRVRYKGTLRDGRVFDERTTEFPLGSVIPCWKESVSMMKVGGHHKIVCPPDLAYGERGAGLIPPGAVLVFDVELLEILQ